MEENQQNSFEIISKSSVKLIKNSRGLNWEIKVVAGEEALIENLRKVALINHNELEKEVKAGEMKDE